MSVCKYRYGHEKPAATRDTIAIPLTLVDRHHKELRNVDVRWSRGYPKDFLGL